MTRSIQLAMAVAMALAMPAWAQGAPPSDSSKGDAANGKKLYLADGCSECHGRAGQGGSMNGLAPILAQTRMPFAGFTRQVRNPINDMPAYNQSMISDQELADIFAFVRSLPGRRPVKDIPILND